MATVTFPSDLTSRLLKEKSIKNKDMHTLITVQLSNIIGVTIYRLFTTV